MNAIVFFSTFINRCLNILPFSPTELHAETTLPLPATFTNLPFVTALCNLTLLNFIIKHMAGSEAHHYTFLKMETVLGIH